MMTPAPENTKQSSVILADWADYWQGVKTGPVFTAIAEPTYRQSLDVLNPDLDAFAEAAVESLTADRESESPVLPALFCDFGTISTARLYGGRVIPPPEGGCLHIEPMAKTPADLADLQACSFEESDFRMAVDLWKKVCDRLGTDDVFLHTPDFQGPMNTLALVMDQQELLIGMYTEPDAIHTALENITSTLINYHQRLRRELGDGKVIGSIWPYTFLPEHLGASITQDMMPLLSPELYRDFEVPQLKRIAEAFGGVQIHCCGKYAQHLEVLKESGIEIRGLEFHHPFTQFADIHAVFGDDIVYIPYLFDDCDDYQDYIEFAASLLGQGTADTRFWFAMAEGWTDGDKMSELVRQHGEH